MESVKVYGEVQLERKVRLERLRLMMVEEDRPSEGHCSRVRECHVVHTSKLARFTPIQRRVFILVLDGASVRQIASVLRTSRQRAYHLVSIVRRKLKCAASDPYFGLHEVYWREVRRYIYRKPRR